VIEISLAAGMLACGTPIYRIARRTDLCGKW
jgi:hypothetical protein